MKSWRTLMFAGLAAAGLALAGCGSDGGPSQAELDAAVEAEKERTEAAEEARDELQEQIAALREALGIDGDADPEATIAELQADLKELQDEQTARMEADQERMAEEARMAAAATGKALFAALAGNATAGTTALDNITATTLAATGTMPLGINAAAGAGTLADATDPGNVELRTGDSAGSLGGWAGTDYARTTGDGAAKVTNEARVYVNKGSGRSLPFSDTQTNGKYTLITTAGATRGYVLLGEAATPVTRASAAAFTHSGTQTHQTPSQRDAFYTSGTYDGANGQFRCAGTNCASTNDGKGTVTSLTGTWHFKPDAGTSAMTHEPDAHYLYYGWWVSKDNDGDPTAASAFTGRVGTDPGNSTDGLDTAAGGATLTGSATYAGNAVGKFALDYSKSKLIDGYGDGGHFTADANFEATFGAGATAGMTGTIDNFRLNDGTDDPGWSVALHRAGWGADGAISAPVDNTATTTVDEAMGTTWTIDGTAADRSGTWSGQMYDETPGNPPAGNGSNVPDTVTGTFYTEYGAGTSTVGRMVGAFGADKE